MGTTLIIIGLFAAFGLAWQVAAYADERARHREEMTRLVWVHVARVQRRKAEWNRAEIHRRREEVALGNNPDEGAP